MFLSPGIAYSGKLLLTSIEIRAHLRAIPRKLLLLINKEHHKLLRPADSKSLQVL